MLFCIHLNCIVFNSPQLWFLFIPVKCRLLRSIDGQTRKLIFTSPTASDSHFSYYLNIHGLYNLEAVEEDFSERFLFCKFDLPYKPCPLGLENASKEVETPNLLVFQEASDSF